MPESPTPPFEMRLSHAEIHLLINVLRDSIVGQRLPGSQLVERRDLVTKLGGLEQDYLFWKKQKEEPQ